MTTWHDWMPRARRERETFFFLLAPGGLPPLGGIGDDEGGGVACAPVSGFTCSP